ncbi:hypothetical protein ACFLWA_11310 [Chloroflexota bacterium]
MGIETEETGARKPTHPWLRRIHLALVPGPMTPVLEEVTSGLLRRAVALGHKVQETPDNTTDAILTTATFGEAVSWRKTLLLTARRTYKLDKTPTVYTLVNATVDEFERLREHFDAALAKEEPDPSDFGFPGLQSQAADVLFEQGRRGGSILALERLVQSQAKCLRILLVLGEELPESAYHFDLVGAYPRSEVDDDLDAFYDDIIFRTVTTVCTDEVTEHKVVGDPILYDDWSRLATPDQMRQAGRELGKRSFFTEIVRISDLVSVPSVGDAVAEQYSEGCFSTWDPDLDVLIATVTGSARPVDKTDISDDDLAVIVGVRPDGQGALARHVEGKRNSPPSSEALEMIDMDRLLPTIELGPGWETRSSVPVARSKLHGHRGVSAYHPEHVEFVPLQPQYYHYIVSCATGAQAEGIRESFSRSQALQNPDDPRNVVFTVLPGHGVFVVEKWVPGKAPFQAIWECMDAGFLKVARRVPQGPMAYGPGEEGLMELEDDSIPC